MPFLFAAEYAITLKIDTVAAGVIAGAIVTVGRMVFSHITANVVQMKDINDKNYALGIASNEAILTGAHKLENIQSAFERSGLKVEAVPQVAPIRKADGA